MPFIEKIKRHRSISTIGLEKNVGKTETLNYIIRRLKNENYKVGLTSIGIDGESVDQVTSTAKPEIFLEAGSIFITSEKHFKMKRFQSEILGVSLMATSLGRLVTAKAITAGHILLSGPTSNSWVKSVIDETLEKGADIVIIDGALSRLSVGSPVITEGIVLSTGAAVSLNMEEVVKKTKHVIDLLKLPVVEADERERLENLQDGIYLVGEEIKELPIKSLLHFNKMEENIFKEEVKLYITGIVTERFLEYLNNQGKNDKIEIIAKDFTKIFAAPEIFRKFLRKGGRIKMLRGTELIAVTVNPVAPSGYNLNSRELVERISEFCEVPVLNLREVEDENL